MLRLGKNSIAGQELTSWPVLLCLALGVLIPSAALLWFMSKAVENEHLAAQQKLRDATRLQLQHVAREIDSFWVTQAKPLLEIPKDNLGTFDEAIEERYKTVSVWYPFYKNAIESLVVLDDQGIPVDPAILQPDRVVPKNPEWEKLERLEVENLKEAVQAYGELIKSTKDTNEEARALQAQLRCFRKLGEKEKVIDIVRQLRDFRFKNSTDFSGRSITPSAILSVLDLLEPGSLEYDNCLYDLYEWGNSSIFSIPRSQRLFIFKELLRLDPGKDTLGKGKHFVRSESFRSRFLAQDKMPKSEPLILDRDLVAFRTNHLVLLISTERLASEIQSVLKALGYTLPSALDSEFVLFGPGDQVDSIATTEFTTLPGYRIGVRLKDSGHFRDLARQQSAVYFWAGGLAVLSITILSLFAARAFTRQVRFARLKNDLVANVTHELKTPLASTRLLVDTLLNNPEKLDQRTREYLELIARENKRLTSLIENFLAFSRMERNKYSFDLQSVIPAEIAEDAASAIQEKFSAADCVFRLEIDSDLPAIRADKDSLVTALINLLENAFKYSEPPRQVSLRCREDHDHVRFEVQDNGIGIPHHEQKKIFQRFYQVDRSLHRTTDGCGLGLSIVEFIAKAHSGVVELQSEPGQGSTFSILLPVSSLRPSVKSTSSPIPV